MEMLGSFAGVVDLRRARAILVHLRRDRRAGRDGPDEVRFSGICS